MTAEPRCWRIAIPGGTGALGTGLALRLARAGHAVTIGSREPHRAEAAAVRASTRIDRRINGASNREAAGEAEIYVLVCGDDRSACETTIGLCQDIGVRGLYVGRLANSAAVEALTSVLIQINRRYRVADAAGIRVTGV